jgi:hypothetical protein
MLYNLQRGREREREKKGKKKEDQEVRGEEHQSLKASTS